MNKFVLIICVCIIGACEQKEATIVFKTFDESVELLEQQKHEKSRMQFKLIQSKIINKNELFQPFQVALGNFSNAQYESLKPYLIEKDIPTIQEAVSNGILSYEQIVLFYLYRIRKYESDSTKMLNSIITLNPTILEEAKEKDKNRPENIKFTMYGLPILLKDNINTIGMPTTAGAFALKENTKTNNAYIVNKLKEHGALILGKANLSEWAYYFCSGCPLGYSAIGGQTLNPYGRRVFESGGSSSGSGVSIAANYAVAAVGTETSGSILSPSGKNSVVGLKPTVGLLSRTGIVPISSTLDTPGPMTKSVIDNAIFLSAMIGEDQEDGATIDKSIMVDYVKSLDSVSIKGKRFGALTSLLKDTIYRISIDILRNAGAEIVEIDPPNTQLNGFITLLNIDMKHDLPKYLAHQTDESVSIRNINDIIRLNLQDTLLRAPYGQQLFEGIIKDETTLEALELIKDSLQIKGRAFFDVSMKDHQLDAVLSINNYHASNAAVAKYPALTVPMGYRKDGEPINLTFISTPFSEKELLQYGHVFEQLVKARKQPVAYK